MSSLWGLSQIGFLVFVTHVILTGDTNSDYPAGTFTEAEAKWPVADLEVRRLRHVVFPELVIPPRGGARAARIRSKAEYTIQTGLSFDGEQAAALVWNSALKRAAGRSGRWNYYYVNVYNAFAGMIKTLLFLFVVLPHVAPALRWCGHPARHLH